MEPTGDRPRDITRGHSVDCGSPMVLLVDSDEEASRVLTWGLGHCGYSVEYVCNGSEALKRALANPPDVVVLDLHLAYDDISGFIVARSLRARYQRLPIVVTTGSYLEDAHEAQARTIGVTDYLRKPVDCATLAISLRAALNTCDERKGQTHEIAETSVPELVIAENAFVDNRLRHLVNRVGQAFPSAWRDVIVEAVEDALLEFLSTLKRGIWPVRRSLDGHLYQAAWRNARDKLQATGRRRANEARYAREQTRLTEFRDFGSWDDEDDLERVFALARSEKEREALRRWWLHESPFRIGEALGVSSLSTAELMSEVKRFKDRIKKRGRRTG